MMNNEPIVCVCRRRGSSVILENLAVVRSVLYTGIVALWFMGAYKSYSNLKEKTEAIKE